MIARSLHSCAFLAGVDVGMWAAHLDWLITHIYSRGPGRIPLSSKTSNRGTEVQNEATAHNYRRVAHVSCLCAMHRPLMTDFFFIGS